MGVPYKEVLGAFGEGCFRRRSWAFPKVSSLPEIAGRQPQEGTWLGEGSRGLQIGILFLEELGVSLREGGSGGIPSFRVLE